MKRITLFTFLLMAAAGGKALAQSGDAPRPVKNGDEWQMPKELLLRAKNFSDGLQKRLQLDQATTKKLFNAYLDNTKSVDEIRIGKGTQKEKQAKLAANQEAFDQSIKGFLTPAQFEGYLKLEKKGKIPGQN